MKKILCFLFACFIALAARAEPRTWTFCEDGKVKIVSGGSDWSFSKGGRINSDFVRFDSTNVVLQLIDGSDGFVPLMSLSEADRAYVTKVKDAPVDKAKLNREAEQRAAQNRAQAEEIEQEMARKKAYELKDAEFYMRGLKRRHDLDEIVRESDQVDADEKAGKIDRNAAASLRLKLKDRLRVNVEESERDLKEMQTEAEREWQRKQTNSAKSNQLLPVKEK